MSYAKYKIIFLFAFLLLFINCKNDNSKTAEESTEKTEKSAEVDYKSFDFSTEKNQNLENWKKYYQSMQEDFDLKKFELVATSDLEIMKGSISAKYEKDFDSIYTDFLIYNPSENKYLDFDSYYWQISEKEDKKEILYNADQEINVIDLKDSTVNRIAFRGPSFTVENAFWKNENTVILLEGTYESSPNINVIDLEENKIYSYSYPDTINKRSHYTEKRIQEKLKL